MDKALVRERLLTRREIDPATGCWLWTGAHLETGYGHMWNPSEKAVRRVHRLAYEAWRGAIPAGQWVLHECDRPPCFNPDHLFLGTPQENMVDASEKGRVKGSQSKLTDRDVLAIYADTRSLRVIARDFGVDCAHVAHIKSGRRWQHLTNPVAYFATGKTRFSIGSEEIRAIRADPRRQQAIAADYGIDPSTVSRIKSGRRRSHVV